MNYSMIRVACASPKMKVANSSYNKEEIKAVIDEAVEKGVKILVLPELSVTGYTCADLFFSSALQAEAEKALAQITKHTEGKGICVIIGAAIAYRSSLYNCAVIIADGKIIGAVPKQHIANYNEFYEKRWFASGKDMKTPQPIKICGFDTKIGSQIFDLGDGVILGTEICEDLWAVNPPSNELACNGANIIVNLSASDEYVSKAQYRKNLVSSQSAHCICAYLYSSSGVYESSTDLVFSGATLIAENGSLLSQGKRFCRENVLTIADIDIEKLNAQRRCNMSFENQIGSVECREVEGIVNDENDLAYRFVDAHPFVPSDKQQIKERCEEIFAIQASGLAKRIEHIGSQGCIIGISGGLDSTLALLVSVEAMKLLNKRNSDILGITMPGFGTTDRTYTNALELMKSLGVEIKEISIKDACIGHMRDIEHNESVKDITYENTQARERTQILFDMANKHNRLLVGTGDLSELAMGWCTYNGDHMSMYGVNASVPKTLVRYLVEYVASQSNEKTRDILLDILDTPVSPELLPPDENGKIAQKTEDNIGPYELHDFFLYNFVRFGFGKEKLQKLAEKAFDGVYDSQTIEKWLNVFLRRFFISQFKRSCIPDGPKVGSVSLSPRGDWRMPSDASYTDFI
ncbi:NAD(+) synthase [uncultured Eubacterium sp.]|uniref:NAD(+) synthase n=1 Tax=uncultured Eubacterium sp. TaxID=165185 RepID=UPI0015ADA43E|nr:NAD(+) synthase [uncultured Eubacterium sp.]